MNLVQLCLLTFLIISCGDNSMGERLDYLGSEAVVLAAPKLEALSVGQKNIKTIEFNSDKLFEVQYLAAYLMEREFYQKFLNQNASLKSSSLNPQTQGLIIRLPLGIRWAFEKEQEVSLELFFSGFPFDKQEFFYTWYDLKEQKELVGRKPMLGDRGYLRNISLERKVFDFVDEANLRLILIASDKKLQSRLIESDHRVKQFPLFPLKRVSSAFDLNLKSLSRFPQNIDENFWLCQNCGQSADINDHYIETSLRKIYESSKVGVVAQQSSQDHRLEVRGLRLGDEVEIILRSKIQAYEVVERRESHRLYLMNLAGDRHLKSSFQCDFTYEDLRYVESAVNFQSDEILEQIILTVDGVDLSLLSYANHYPERLYTNGKGELILNYLNTADGVDMSVAFTEQKRLTSLRLKGTLLMREARQECLDALNANKFKNLKDKIRGRTVRAQDVFSHNISLKVYGTPRI